MQDEKLYGDLTFDQVVDVVREMDDNEFEVLTGLRELLNAGIVVAVPITDDGEAIN